MAIPPKFYQSVKSTVDSIGVAIAEDVKAQIPDIILNAATLDGIAGLNELLTSPDPAIVWSLNLFEEAPVDPLYRLVFSIGPRTVDDTASQLMSILIGAVQQRLPSRQVFKIKNYQGAAVSEELGERGYAFVTSTTIQEQMYDNISSLRMMLVNAVVSRDLD